MKSRSHGLRTFWSSANLPEKKRNTRLNRATAAATSSRASHNFDPKSLQPEASKRATKWKLLQRPVQPLLTKHNQNSGPTTTMMMMLALIELDKLLLLLVR